MSPKHKPAACNAAGSVDDAFSWQATPRLSSRKSRRAEGRKCDVRRMRIGEIRVRFAGRLYTIRLHLDDPLWRVRALAAVDDPLSDIAFAIRAAPLTIAERVDFAIWAECEQRRIWEGAV